MPQESIEQSALRVRPIRSSRRSHLGLIVGLWAVPVAAVLVGFPIANLLEREAHSVSAGETISVGSRENLMRTAVTLKIALKPGAAVAAGRGGTVTAIHVRDGEIISLGMKLIEVDYEPVVAFSMPTPLVRDLSVGDDGPDVEVLSMFLARLGYLSEADISSEFGWTVESAVEAFQSALGFDDDGAFRLSYVAFVPPGAESVGQLNLSVGSQISAGTPLFASTSTPTSSVLAPIDPSGTLTGFSGRSVTIEAGANTFELSSIQPEGDELGGLLDWLEAAVADGLVTVDSSDKSAFMFTGLTVALSDPATVGTVPSSAILVGASAECVVVLVSGGLDLRILDSAQPSSGEFGVVGVDEDLVGAKVLRDASSAPASIRAQCK